MSRYEFQAIERKWQRVWEERGTFRTPGPGDPAFDANQPKLYVLDMFPYPSGAGLHVGHPLGYIGTDVYSRFKRMQQYNVLHPMGFDAFGLPAEQYAIEHGVHPRVTTERNMSNMLRQLKSFGLSYDWDRLVATIDPEYYRWTQWIFLKIFGSWFDPEVDAARPIGELRARLEAGELEVDEEGLPSAPGPGSRPFSALDESERRRVIDGQRLAYLADVPVNWCPALGTVLANEEVTNEGRSERGNHPVVRRPLKQWQLRITAYAQRLLDDLELVDWPEAIKAMQRNWIGPSQGARVDFPLADGSGSIEVFTTRPDTLFGATYMVLAPEHPLVDRVTTSEHAEEVAAYRAEALGKSELARQEEPQKTGVPTGGHAINPVTGEPVPIWVADYVLVSYGTGAIMAVPAHDERDFEFAQRFGLPLRTVVEPPDEWLLDQEQSAGGAGGDPGALRERHRRDPASFPAAFCGEGRGVQSANEEVSLDGLPTNEAKARINQWLESKGLGRAQVQYKLRDWLFSRQRYWGEPFPILHGPDGEIRAVDESELPVELPDMEDFRPPGGDGAGGEPEPSLARAPESWKSVEIDGRRYRRELNTMPQWAGSCWYYLRFIDPRNDQRFVAPEKEMYWMTPKGVDLYVGGVEHAVLHLLYARFWHKVLHDLGHVSTPEPFGRLFNQGYIQAWAYQDPRGVYVPAEEVEETEDGFRHRGEPVTRTYGKMGKSLKNAVSPDEMFERFGCDTLRLYEMYMGPLESSKPWNTRDIVGVHRFLHRVWRNFVDPESGAWRVGSEPASDELRRAVHRTIRDVTQDMERLSFNTAIAKLIELNNQLVPLDALPREVAEPFVLMLAPFAPHLAEELWERLGHEASLAREQWPQADPELLVEQTVEIAVQVAGKTRATIALAPDAGEEQAREAALADPRVARHTEGKTVRKVIYVPGRLINIVAT
jgi:leucyl-tRNA synthetase